MTEIRDEQPKQELEELFVPAGNAAETCPELMSAGLKRIQGG